MLFEIYSSASSASVLGFPPPLSARLLSSKPVVIHQEVSAPESSAAATPSREPVVALPREPRDCLDNELAGLDKSFFARDDRVLDLKLSLSITAPTEASLRV